MRLPDMAFIYSDHHGAPQLVLPQGVSWAWATLAIHHRDSMAGCCAGCLVDAARLAPSPCPLASQAARVLAQAGMPFAGVNPLSNCSPPDYAGPSPAMTVQSG